MIKRPLTTLIVIVIIGIITYNIDIFPKLDDYQSNIVSEKVQPKSTTANKESNTGQVLTNDSLHIEQHDDPFDLADYINLSQQQRLELIFLKDREQAVAVLLALIDNGLLGINEPLRQGNTAPSEHYTALFTAITVSAETSPLSLEQLEQFLSRGAIIDGQKGAWRRIAAIPELPLEVSWRMIQEGNFGEDSYLEMRDLALHYGNSALFKKVADIQGYPSEDEYQIIYKSENENISNYIKKIQSTGYHKNFENRAQNVREKLLKKEHAIKMRMINTIKILLESKTLTAVQEKQMQLALQEIGSVTAGKPNE